MKLARRSTVLSVSVFVLLGCRPAADAPPASPPAAAPPAVSDVLASSDLPEVQERPLAGDPMAVTVHRLSNGLTVYVSTDREKPRFSAWIAVRAGSRHDPASSTGLAHYLEHMLFKGTAALGTLDMAKERPHLERIAGLYDELRSAGDEAQRKAVSARIDAETQASAQWAIPNELDRLYATLGVQGLNAFTSDDQTVYIADVPANRLEAWARVEGERLAHPAFRLFYPELEAVYEEKNLSLDDPDTRAYETVALALYPRHPYGTQPTIGHMEHLKTPAYADMVAFFERWYVPNNVAIVLAGDVEAAAAVEVLERQFGAWKPEALQAPAPGELPRLSGRTFREIRAEAEERVMLAWHTVPVLDADEPTLYVLDLVMDNASTGLLNLELELTQKVPEAGSFHASSNEAGSWQLYATAREGQALEDVEKLLLGVVEKLKKGEFTQADIDAIVLNRDISEKQRLESNDGRVAKMAGAFIERRSWEQTLARDRAIARVTRDDVVRVANRHLGGDHVTLFRRKGVQTPPRIEKPTITPVPIDPTRKSPFAADIERMEAPPLEPEWLEEGKHYQRAKLPAGPLVAAGNPRNDLFRLEYRFDRGSRREPLLCHALDVLEQSGAGDLTAEALQKKLYALGLSIDFVCSADDSRISVAGVDGKLEEAIAVLDQWLRKPKIDPARVRELVENRISQRRDEMDDPRQVGAALAAYAQLGLDSPWLHEPSNAKLRATGPELLARLLARVPDHTHRTLYFGPRASAAVASIVALGKGHRKVPPPRPQVFRRVDRGGLVYLVHKDVSKSEIEVAVPHPPLPRAERPLAALYSEYLGGGMGGLMFQEIREARGLAYYAYAGVDYGSLVADQAALVGGVGTQVDKTVETLRLYLELVGPRPIQERRAIDSKVALEAIYRASRIDRRRVVDSVARWDRLGEPSDPRPWIRARVAELQTADLQAFATRLAARPSVISIVGDRARLDLAGLKALGKLVELKTDQLHSYGAAGPKATSATTGR